MGTQAISSTGASTSNVDFKPTTNMLSNTNITFDSLANAIKKNAELTDKRNRDIAKSSYDIEQKKINANKEIAQVDQAIKNKEIDTKKNIDILKSQEDKNMRVAELSLADKEIERKALLTKSIIFISVFTGAIYVFAKAKKSENKKGKK